MSSFFLVTFHNEHADVRKAGWIYLVASHLATAFLIFLFAVLGSRAGSFEFADWTSAPPAAGALFLVALIGFGTKAGIVPLHVWLPQAHPAAPSHVSAVMSGVMIKTGIYGLLRVTGFLGAPEAMVGIRACCASAFLPASSAFSSRWRSMTSNASSPTTASKISAS